MTLTKVVRDNLVYARQEFGDERVVLEKMDPRILHDAPATVAPGAALDVTFTIVDFDGEARTDSEGVLLLDVAGTPLSLPFENGTATLQIDLFASGTVTQMPPYFCDARMDPFEIEVTS